MVRRWLFAMMLGTVVACSRTTLPTTVPATATVAQQAHVPTAVEPRLTLEPTAPRQPAPVPTD